MKIFYNIIRFAILYIFREYIWVAEMTGTTKQKNGTYLADFCGFYTNYSIMVAIQRKDIPVSGGAMSGSIFKEVVEYITNKTDCN